MYDFDKIVKRTGTNCFKWDRITSIYNKNDLLPMWIADMDFEMEPKIAQAVKDRASHLIYGYTYASDNFYDNIIKWNKKRNGYAINKEWINVSIGVVPSIKAAIFGFTDIDDKVMIQTPVYPPFYHSVTKAKRKLIKPSDF